MKVRTATHHTVVSDTVASDAVASDTVASDTVVSETLGRDIVVYVKEGYYDEPKDCWVYKVQEKDKDGNWCDRERWKRETALKRA
jgi:hypothetical protein